MEHLENLVIDFYYHSLNNSLDEFDFEEAFDELEPFFYNKLAEHGLLSFNDFVYIIDEIYGLNNLEKQIPDELTMVTNYINFDKRKALDAILNAMYEECQHEFGSLGSLQELSDLYEQLLDRPKSLKEKTILFDSCIHAQHQTGDLIEDLNTESCKEEAEVLYKESNPYMSLPLCDEEL
jgi:hypothetical protein